MERFAYAAFIAMISIMILVSGYYINEIFSEIDLPESKVFEVKKGMTMRQIAENLENENIISNKLYFIFWAKVKKENTNLKAGIYEFSGKTNIDKILKKLVLGKEKLLKVTIPEGIRLEKIIEILSTFFKIDQDKFIELVKDNQFAEKMGFENVNDLSGYLFPETYFFPIKVKEEQIIEKMLSTFKKNLPPDYENLLKSQDFTLNEIVTLASIVQNEMYNLEEAPKIAAVYHNRLKQNWKLQADPTIRYALNLERERIYYKDLDFDSPYNTYKYKGLPPTPISNPGKIALDAAFFPEANFDYMYFVADKSGNHIFSKTNREHINNKNKIKNEKRKN